MTRFLTDLAAGLTPYVPGEQPKDRTYVKLNTNENPYPPSEQVLQAIREAMDGLRLYPDPDTTALRETIAASFQGNFPGGAQDNLPSGAVTAANVFVGNGSDEVLAFAFPAFFAERMVVFPNITYSFYPVYAQLFKTEFVEIPLGSDFNINPEDYTYLSSLWPKPAGILIPNPNAPTGRCLSLEEIRLIVASNPDIVVLIDEAYIDFGGESAVQLVPLYDNLLVVQTLSKSRALAGLRAGFAIGSVALIEALNRIKNSFNSYTVDRLAMAGARAAMLDQGYFEKTRDQIIDTRERVVARLTEMGFSVLPSKANFIFISHSNKPAVELFDGLRQKGVLVRYFNKPLIDNYLRVSIGTEEEMDIFLRCMAELIAR